MQQRALLAIWRALNLRGPDFEKFSARGGRGGRPSPPPPHPPPRTLFCQSQNRRSILRALSRCGPPPPAGLKVLEWVLQGMKLARLRKMQQRVLLAMGEALNLRGPSSEKFSAGGGRGGCGETQLPPPGTPLQESAPQINFKALFSLWAAAAGRSQSIGGRASRDEAYSVAKRMQQRVTLAIGEALILKDLDFEKFSACGGRVRVGVGVETQSNPPPHHHHPDHHPPPPPLPESAPQTNSLFSLWAAAAGRAQSIIGRASRDEAYPVTKKCNKESFWQ